MHTAHVVLSLLAEDKEKAPDANDVVAGWTGLLVFVLLILAVVAIGWALTRSLRTAQRAKEQGVYGDDPESAEPPSRLPFDDEVSPPSEDEGNGPDWR